MKTALIYRTQHGTTETVAKLIAEKYDNGNIDLINLKKNKKPELENYDKIIIGGSIHVGLIQSQLKKFCEANLENLLKKEIGLFICCMLEEKKDEEFENAFSEVLRNHSKANAILGGEILFEKMNFLERFITKKVAKIKESVSNINYEEIDKFVQKLK